MANSQELIRLIAAIEQNLAAVQAKDDAMAAAIGASGAAAVAAGHKMVRTKAAAPLLKALSERLSVFWARVRCLATR